MPKRKRKEMATSQDLILKKRSSDLKEIIPVLAAGGVLFDLRNGSGHVVLIFKRGVWDLPKGKKEENESIKECAQREVAEEVGCPLPEIFDEIATTYHEYERGETRFGKTTHWFSMMTDTGNGFEPDETEGIKEARWFDINEAKKTVGYENLKKVLESFDDWLNERA